jgi:futalosine hydrolase
MKILLTAATEAEIAPLTEYIATRWKRVSEHSFEQNGHIVTICIAGVGMVATAYSTTKALLTGRYDLAIQAGIGGSFDKDIALGEIVMVSSEQFGDLGAEDNGSYIDIFDLGLIQMDGLPFTGTELLNPGSPIHEKIGLKQAKSLTVNTVSGHASTIERLAAQYNCQVESMEGAAFHYCCLLEKVPFLQLRAISNYVEPRDKSKWKMGAAVNNLNNYIIQLLDNV